MFSFSTLIVHYFLGTFVSLYIDTESIGYGVLLVCLAPSIAREEVEELASGIIGWYSELRPATDTHVFFRDSAFADDITKTNLSAILEQHGISHVRSL